MTETAYFTTLENRGLIHIEGPDRDTFLQDLITNDITQAQPGKLLYACLLTPQGKFLHDFFIHNTGEAYLLDCEGGERTQDLYDRFIKYRMRKKVQISIDQNNTVYACIGTDFGLVDPRHKEMGTRSFEKPGDIQENTFEKWDKHRISLTIPDGSRDLIPEKSTMSEANMDTLNAIDYEKGCYIGQELTARMHYRNLGKKSLKTIDISKDPNADIRSSQGNQAIALVRN